MMEGCGRQVDGHRFVDEQNIRFGEHLVRNEHASCDISFPGTNRDMRMRYTLSDGEYNELGDFCT